MILLPQTELALEQSRPIVNNPDTDPAIVAYLTRYINVLMCAEIESVVTVMVRERIERGIENDVAVVNYLQSINRSAVRNAKYREIANTLGLFGADYKTRFQTDVNARIGESGIERLGFAVGKRDATTHDAMAQPDITFAELEDAYKAAEEVVDTVKNVLSQ